MADAIDDLFRRFGKAFNKADVDEIAACVTDDFEWRLSAGGAPSGRVLKGKEDLRALLRRQEQGAPRSALLRSTHPPRRRQAVRHRSAPPASTMPASRSTVTASTSTK